MVFYGDISLSEVLAGWVFIGRDSPGGEERVSLLLFIEGFPSFFLSCVLSGFPWGGQRLPLFESRLGLDPGMSPGSM